MNVMPNLTADEFERLRADIEQRGVLDAVIYDERGRVLDGHNRVAIASVLGIGFPTQVLDLGDATDEDRDQVAATLNINRRQLTPDERRELAIRFRLANVPGREVAALLGVTERSVTSYSARAVGEDRKRRAKEARELIEAGASQNEAAKVVGLPQRTLSDRLSEKGKSSDFAKRRPAKPKRYPPRFLREFGLWCKRAIPEDREHLLRLDAQLHKAIQQANVVCGHEA